jgi:hypothetical protein
MFQALFKRAQATVDSAISDALNRVLLAIPFVIAVGFAMAAAWTELYERMGPTGANLSIAGAFAVIGLVMAPFLIGKSAGPGTTEAAGEQTAATGQATDSAETGMPGLGAIGEVDGELVRSVVMAIGPTAVPFVFRNLVRNLPLVILAAAAIFVMMQMPSGTARPSEAEGEPEPAV